MLKVTLCTLKKVPQSFIMWSWLPSPGTIVYYSELAWISHVAKLITNCNIILDFTLVQSLSWTRLYHALYLHETVRASGKFE